MDSGTGTKSPHILILEDESAHRDLALRAFHDDPEMFRVSVAGTIREARQILEHDPPDLIIADWLLPDGKGIEVLPRRDGMVTVPLIVMTSHGDERLAVEIMKSGSIDYVVKSLSAFKELPHTARHALRDWDNILQRQRAEEELRAKERQLSLIYRNVSEVLLFLSVEQDNRYRFLSVNQLFLDVTGLTQEQVVGKYVHEVIPEPSLTLVLGKYKQAIEDKTTVSWEEITDYPGGKKYGEVRISPLIDETGRCTNLVGSVHDITERKRTELALRESEAKYRTLIENSGTGIIIVDRNGTYLMVNRRAADLMGAPPHEIIGKTMIDFLPDDTARRYLARNREMIDSGEGREYEDTFELKTGKRTFFIIDQIIKDSSGRGIALQSSSVDITDRKRAEEALRESEENTGILPRTFTMVFISMTGPPISCSSTTGPQISADIQKKNC